MPTGDQGFPKSVRLRARPQFLAVGRAGRKLHSRDFLVLWTPNQLEHHRIGITVTRKVAGAVGRNRVKRMVREAFRRFHKPRGTGADMVVIAKRGAAGLNGRQTARQIADLLKMIGSAGRARS